MKVDGRGRGSHAREIKAACKIQKQKFKKVFDSVAESKSVSPCVLFLADESTMSRHLSFEAAACSLFVLCSYECAPSVVHLCESLDVGRLVNQRIHLTLDTQLILMLHTRQTLLHIEHGACSTGVDRGCGCCGCGGILTGGIAILILAECGGRLIILTQRTQLLDLTGGESPLRTHNNNKRHIDTFA